MYLAVSNPLTSMISSNVTCMTVDERLAASRTLKERLYPNAEDVRDCLRDRSKPVTFQKTFRSLSGSSIITTCDFYSLGEKQSFSAGRPKDLDDLRYLKKLLEER